MFLFNKTLLKLMAASIVCASLLACSNDHSDVQETDEPPVLPSVHEHSFSDVWEKDDTYHWHKCEGCDEISDKEEHSFAKTETHRQSGYSVYSCQCGYSFNTEIMKNGNDSCYCIDKFENVNSWASRKEDKMLYFKSIEEIDIFIESFSKKNDRQRAYYFFQPIKELIDDDFFINYNLLVSRTMFGRTFSDTFDINCIEIGNQTLYIEADYYNSHGVYPGSSKTVAIFAVSKTLELKTINYFINYGKDSSTENIYDIINL